MDSFGPFEVAREIDSATGSTVFKARKKGDPRGEYVVKLLSLERLVAEEPGETKAELDPLLKGISGSFAGGIRLQKKAAEGSQHFAPILAAGQDERGTWYATDFYARSVKGMLDRFVMLDPSDLFHLAQSLVKAALHLKQGFGRSHGNLKPSNIFIDGTGRLRNSRVTVTDPLPGEAASATVYEVADLRAIGEIIYQLVLRHKVDFSTGWVMLPVEASREWTGLFKKQTAAWLELCNQLLDPHLSLDRYNLEKCDADLAKLKPSSPAPRILCIAAISILLLATAVFLLSRLFH